MKKILMALAVATTLFLAGCASPTDSKPAIAVSITGATTYAVNTDATLTANATYTGTGTLSYKWDINGTDPGSKTKTLIFKSPSAYSFKVTVVVTDGTQSGTASTTVTFQ